MTKSHQCSPKRHVSLQQRTEIRANYQIRRKRTFAKTVSSLLLPTTAEQISSPRDIEPGILASPSETPCLAASRGRLPPNTTPLFFSCLLSPSLYFSLGLVKKRERITPMKTEKTRSPRSRFRRDRLFTLRAQLATPGKRFHFLKLP